MPSGGTEMEHSSRRSGIIVRVHYHGKCTGQDAVIAKTQMTELAPLGGLSPLPPFDASSYPRADSGTILHKTAWQAGSNTKTPVHHRGLIWY
jgi:hypothetical protein